MQSAEIRSRLIEIFGEFEEEGEFGQKTRAVIGLEKFDPPESWEFWDGTCDEIRNSQLKIVILWEVKSNASVFTNLEFHCFAGPYDDLSDREIAMANSDNYAATLFFDDNDKLDLAYRPLVTLDELNANMFDRFIRFWILDVWNFWLFLSKNN